MKHRQQHLEQILRTIWESDAVDYPSSAAQILALFADDSAAKPARWKPQHGEDYWFIWDTGQIKKKVWGTWSYDAHRWEIGNCFQTRHQAERARDGLQDYLQRFHACETSLPPR